jgi:raffinose/stachyose/melibiose transport system permease protein
MSKFRINRNAIAIEERRRDLATFSLRLRRNPKLFLTYAVLIVYAFVSLYPIIWMLLMSLKTNPEVHTNLFGLPYGMPNEWQWNNYLHVLTTTRIPRYILNSGWISAMTVLGILLFSLPAGFAFGQLEFKGNDLLFMLLLAGIMIPGQTTILPLFLQMKRFDLLDTPWAMIVPYVAAGLPFATFLMRGFFRSLPKELADAAVVDGASLYRVFWDVMMPLTRPAISTLIVFYFMWTWNEFLWAMLVMNKELFKTVTVGVFTTFQNQYMFDWPLMTTGLVLVTMPIVLIFLIFQRQFIEGLTAGALKG